MHGKIVSNTGPLIALGLIDRLDILQKLFSEVFVSEMVFSEIMEGGDLKVGLDPFQKLHG